MTDKEIKDFIDGREVLTQNELKRFMYPNASYSTNRKSNRTERYLRWWDYVLRTKDPVKMREYSIEKQHTANLKTEEFETFKKAYEADYRINELGKRSLKKFLKKHYNIDLGLTTIQRYKQRCSQNNS